MSTPGKGRPTVCVFSALEYFRAAATGLGCAHYLGSELSIPVLSNGIEEVGFETRNRTLTWVDGLARQSLALHDFVRSLRSEEIPVPLVQSSPLPTEKAVSYVSPSIMREKGETIGALIGLTDVLLPLAMASPVSDCEKCGNNVRVFQRPDEIVAVLSEDTLDLAPFTVSINARGPDALSWGERAGFSSTLMAENLYDVAIEAVSVQHSSLFHLVPVIQSAWSLPDFGVAVRTKDGLQKLYAPHGVCARCHTRLGPRAKNQLREILTHGLRDSSGLSAERCIKVHGLTISQLLERKLNDPDIQHACQALMPPQLLTTLMQSGFGAYNLGFVASVLPSDALCRLAIIRTASRCSDDSVAIIDVPHGLQPKEYAEEIDCLLGDLARRTPVILLGRPPGNSACSPVVSRDPTLTGDPLASLRPDERVSLDIRLGVQVAPCFFPPVTDARELSLSQGDVITVGGSTLIAHIDLSISMLGIFDSFRLKKKTLIEELGLFEPLTKLVAGSVDAKVHGITAKELALRPQRASRYSCPECCGWGLKVEWHDCFDRPTAGPCHVCDGARFKSPVNSILLRGLSLGQILNSPFSSMTSLLKILPKSAPALSLIDLLDLSHLPVGMPLPLLSFSERRRVQLLCAALRAHSARTPLLAFVEHPFCGLSERHAAQVGNFLKSPSHAPHAAWVIVGNP